MDSSVSTKDEIWFLRVCHHISTGLYLTVPWLRLVVAYLLIEETRVRSQCFRCGIFLETERNWGGFFFEYFIFACRCNSISAAQSSLFIYSFYEKDKWAKPGILLLGCVISGMSR